MIEPELGLRIPSTHSIVVVLPAPLGPMRPKIHVDQGGELAVVGVLVRKDPADQPNTTIGLILEALAQGRPTNLNPRGLFPSTSYYGYAGSLTTPPCTEGVRWHLLDGWITVSQGQIDKFKEYHAGNARPPQNANGRVILKKE